MEIPLITFLKIMGLEPIYMTLDIKYRILNVIYSLFIFLLIGYYSMLLFVAGIQYDDLEIIGRFFFNVVHTFQYYVSYFYFKYQKKKRLYESEELQKSNNSRMSLLE